MQKLLKTFIGQNGAMGIDSEIRAGEPKYAAMPQNGTAGKSNLGNGTETSSADIKSSQSNIPNAESDHSTTNLQVEGVDEEDLVKTDGEYIFKVNQQKIINIIKTKSDSTMEAINNITFEDNYNINGIFLRKNILVVVGNDYQNPMFNGQYLVDRIIYIKDTLYTISNGLIKADDINTLKEKSKLKTVDNSKIYPTDGVREVIPMPVPQIIK